MIPIGSNEQHGPTGLLGTDWLCPEIIAHEAQKTGDILVAPTFNIGMAQHHLDFPGTIALRPSTFMLAIGDWCRSLAHHGFEKIYFLNGHGGNVATIEAAFSELYAEASYSGRNRGFACKLKNWWELQGRHGRWPTASSRSATAAMPRRPRSRSPSGAIRTASRPPTTRRRSPPTGPIREAATSAPAIADGRWAPTPAWRRPRRAANWSKLLAAAVAAARRRGRRSAAETRRPCSAASPGAARGDSQAVNTSPPRTSTGQACELARLAGAGDAGPSRRNSAPWPAQRMWRPSRVR